MKKNLYWYLFLVFAAVFSQGQGVIPPQPIRTLPPIIARPTPKLRPTIPVKPTPKPEPTPPSIYDWRDAIASDPKHERFPTENIGERKNSVRPYQWIIQSKEVGKRIVVTRKYKVGRAWNGETVLWNQGEEMEVLEGVTDKPVDIPIVPISSVEVRQ